MTLLRLCFQDIAQRRMRAYRDLWCRDLSVPYDAGSLIALDGRWQRNTLTRLALQQRFAQSNR